MTWKRYEVGTNQITATGRKGRPCWQMSTARDEPCGKWGDSPPAAPRKRAQFRELEFHAYDTPYSIRFATLIPQDWIVRSDAEDTGIFDFHQYSTPGGTPFQINVLGDELIIRLGTIQKLLWRGLWVPEQWDDWLVSYVPSVVNGSISVVRNGVEIVNEAGVQTAYADTKGNYTKVGPYMFAGADPSQRVKYRRMFVQVPGA